MAEIVTTIKGDGAAPWIVVHAETPSESERLITEALGGLLQTAAEAGELLTTTVQASKQLGANAGAPQTPQAPVQWQNGPQGGQQGYQDHQAPRGGDNNNWQPQQQQNQGGFIGSAHPEGKRCGLCGSVLIGQQPKVKRMWKCPNQKRQDDGHTVEWIN